MQVLQGIAVSPGVAIGEALVVDREGFRIPRRFVSRDAVDDELERLHEALEEVSRDIAQNRDSVAAQLGDQYAGIFSAHLAILNDQQLLQRLRELISHSHFSPEYAVSVTLRKYAQVFQELHTEHAHDIFDIERNLLRALLGRRREELGHVTSPVVVLAHNLTPSETANLSRQYTLGFATEIGGAGGHTAIVAKGLEIPAVVGCGRFLSELSGGDLVIIDGDRGQVVVDPDEVTVARYEREQQSRRARSQQLEELRELPAQTLDGTPVSLLANIEFPGEVETCARRGAMGIGLYRTEFLYLGSDAEPTEDDHFRAYASVAQAMGERPVVIRTLDLGADKMGRATSRGRGGALARVPLAEDERNPFLGLRSIRLALRNVELFRTQLRAILKASNLGNVHLMFPLITTLNELRQAKAVLADAMDELERAGVPFNPRLPVGMMVEVPAAVIMLDRFLPEVDFISIGSNDLVQYALAVDRSNEEVASLYQESDPAVLRLIRTTIEQAAQFQVPVSLCGTMSASPAYALLLLGLGLRSFSVPPSSLLAIKQLCRSVELRQCEALAERVMKLDNAAEVADCLRQELERYVPRLDVTPPAS